MKPKSIELVAFDRNHNLQFEGKCKLKIDRISSMLLVEPENEECKMKYAMFKWDIVLNKNILLVFGENELNDFALIFDDEIRCKKVYDFIVKDKVQNEIEKEIIYQRLLNPIFEKISSTNTTEILELRKIMVQWIDKHGGEEKDEYLKMLKDKNIFDIVYSRNAICFDDGENTITKNATVNEKRYNSRKRKHREAKSGLQNGENDFSKKVSKKKKFSKIFIKNQSQFKLVNIQTGSESRCVLRRRLLIFTSNDKTHCYEYLWNPWRNLFCCIGCREKGKDATAILVKNGIDDIKVESKKHLCTPIPYIPQNYVEMKIFKKPDFEILENCNTYSGKILIIFDQNDKTQCWEFRSHHERTFRCRKCNTTAKLWNKNTENEYVELLNANHQCQYIPYNTKNYYQFQDFVLLPDFEIQTAVQNGKEKKRLIIFDKNNRNFCYFYSAYHGSFLCIQCRRKGAIISAKIFQNSDGEDYVILSKMKHICELQPYKTFSTKNEIIVRSPDFELMENTENGKNKLFIFDSNNRNLCYTFSGKESNNCKIRYNCLECENIRRYKKCSETKLSTKAIYANFFKDKNYVKLNDGKHICEPKKYEPKKFEKKEIQKCYDFFFYRQKRFPTSVNAAIYHPENRKLCYSLNYKKRDSYFQCNGCQIKGKVFTKTKIQKDENEKEYFKIDHKQHICEPIKVSSICAPKFIKLKREEIKWENEMNEKIDEKIDKKRIVTSSNFELRSIKKHGTTFESIFVFCSEDQNFGYEYSLRKSNRIYFCTGPSCQVTAKLQLNEAGEKCVILGKSQHKCEPVKYGQVVEDKNIPASDFITISENDKISKIIVFATSDRDKCYEFGFNRSMNLFRCLGCKMINKHISVKLCKDENDKEYLQMSGKDHICAPRKYVKEKYEPNTYIPKELFKLHSNTKGESNKRLIIFTSDKKELVYEFYAKRENYFKCLACTKKKHGVSLKLLQNGNLMEVGTKIHVCEPQKYDPKKYVFS